ncbi:MULTISPECIES: hypothetical protein [Geobacillus]|uniref:hypothetical protein n=1 Tax=Geobacillus TaxID=129337 RepID=UPI0006994125|nr:MULTISPECIES: hypothetical protein [Geobacillus]ASS87988.1 hypothetical protein GLN3_13775 [Geobacillus lituanicus]
MHRGSHRGAKTFRRGRALEFLERLYVKRVTLKQQLQSPELQSIHAILTGELKAIEMVINEFVQSFEIHEDELKTRLKFEKRDNDDPTNGHSGDESNAEE